MSSKIHPTALVDPSAVIGKDTVVWQSCIILAGARIGEGCKLAHNVFVESGVEVGSGITIKDNVALYDGVRIEDDAFIGPNVVFTNVLTPRAFVSRADEFSPTVIGKGASLGANSTIICGNTVGSYAMIGAGSVVTSDVPDYGLVIGNPGRRVGWVSRVGRVLNSDLICPETGERYVMTPTGVIGPAQ